MLFHLFMILFLAGLCGAKTIVQGNVGRSLLETTGAVLFFNGIYFTAAMLCALPGALRQGGSVSGPTVWYACLFGLISVLFQFGATSGMRTGPVSLTVMLVNLSCSLPIIAGLALWRETPSPWFFPGLTLMAVTLVFSADLKDLRIPAPGRWVFFVLLTFFCSGSLNIVQKLHQFTSASGERGSFVMISSLVSTVSAFTGSLLASKDRSVLKPLLKPRTLCLSASVGLILSVYQQLCLYMAHRMPASIFYPALSGMTLTVCTLVGVVCFRDPFGKKQKLCILCGILSVIFLSI